MADAVSAYKEAFASYSKSIADYSIYSIVMLLASSVVTVALIVALMAFGALSAATLQGAIAAGGPVSLGTVAVALLLLALGTLVLLWITSGLAGAYCETLVMFLSGRKQTLGGFFGAVMRRAFPVLSVALITGILISIPFICVVALNQFIKLDMLYIALMLLAFLASLIIGVLFIFAVPAVVVDGRGPVAAMRASMVAVLRNLFAVAIYIVITMALGLVMLIPIIGQLVFLPLSQSALIALYKQARK